MKANEFREVKLDDLPDWAKLPTTYHRWQLIALQIPAPEHRAMMTVYAIIPADLRKT